MGALARLNNARNWSLVTNKVVAECADPDCKACRGAGLLSLGDDGLPIVGVTVVCKCAPPRFNRTYHGRLRISGGQVEFKRLVAL